MQERPSGVTVLAILVIAVGILGIIGGLITSVVGVVVWPLIVVGLTILILSVIEVIVGVGLLRLRPWAWTVAVVVTVIRLAADIIGLIQGASIPLNIITIFFNALILWYLFRPTVREAFR